MDHFAIFHDHANQAVSRRSFISDAAKKCKVALVVVSKEYLSTEWLMDELVEFVRALVDGNESLILIPLFDNVLVGDLRGHSIRDVWIPRWQMFNGTQVEEYAAAVEKLLSFYGLSLRLFGNSEVKYRDAIVEGIVSYDRICEVSKSSKVKSGIYCIVCSIL